MVLELARLMITDAGVVADETFKSVELPAGVLYRRSWYLLRFLCMRIRVSIDMFCG